MTAARFEIRPATHADVPGLQVLVSSTPQAGSITINFERTPNFFHGSQVVATELDVWVMADNHNKCLAGVFSIGSREVYVNGVRKRVRYGNDLRIHPDYQGGRSFFRLFKKYREIMEDEWMQTVILSENKNSLSTVGSGRAGLPNYYEYGQLKTSMVYLKKQRLGHKKRFADNKNEQTHVTIRRATESDLAVMQAFADCEAKKRQFFPHYDFSQMHKGDAYYRGLRLTDYFLAFRDNSLVGITGVWDQKAFKQTRFLAYNGAMRFLRHINNWQSHFTGGVSLPKAGSVLEYLLLHCILIENNDTNIFRQLFSAIFSTHSSDRYAALVCGLSVDDPLNTVMDGYRKQVLSSRHFIASYSEDPRNQFDGNRQLYLEAARL